MPSGRQIFANRMWVRVGMNEGYKTLGSVEVYRWPRLGKKDQEKALGAKWPAQIAGMIKSDDIAFQVTSIF